MSDIPRHFKHKSKAIKHSPHICLHGINNRLQMQICISKTPRQAHHIVLDMKCYPITRVLFSLTPFSCRSWVLVFGFASRRFFVWAKISKNLDRDSIAKTPKRQNLKTHQFWSHGFEVHDYGEHGLSFWTIGLSDWHVCAFNFDSPPLRLLSRKVPGVNLGVSSRNLITNSLENVFMVFCTMVAAPPVLCVILWVLLQPHQ